MALKNFLLMILLIFAASFLFGCGPRTKTIIPPQVIDNPSQPSMLVEKQTWEIEWDKTLIDAKKEGKVKVVSTLEPALRGEISKLFKSKYNLEIEFVSGSAGELAEKILREKRAGINDTDIIILGGSVIIAQLKPAGALSPLEPLLMLPEVKDARKWRNNELPFLDKKGFAVKYLTYDAGSNALLRNINLVREDEIRSIKDLLEPKWQGKIALLDPTIPGRMQYLVIIVIQVLGAEGTNFWKEMMAKQKIVLTRDLRVLTEWVAHGKYALALGHNTDLSNDFIREGAPLGTSALPGINWVSSGRANLAVSANPAHPGSARIFINWFLSKETQAFLTKFQKLPSRRIDVSLEDVPAEFLIREGINYFDSDTEDFINSMPKYVPIIRDIFSPLLK